MSVACTYIHTSLFLHPFVHQKNQEHTTDKWEVKERTKKSIYLRKKKKCMQVFISQHIYSCYWELVWGIWGETYFLLLTKSRRNYYQFSDWYPHYSPVLYSVHLDDDLWLCNNFWLSLGRLRKGTQLFIMG